MTTIIGVDPGVTTGLAVLTFDRIGSVPVMVYQANYAGVPSFLRWALSDRVFIPSIALESFVDSRHSRTREGVITRELVGVVTALADITPGVKLHTRRAADVKPWATDERLHAAGLLEPTEHMRHARDAARHALFAAVRDHGVPDPLSKRA